MVGHDMAHLTKVPMILLGRGILEYKPHAPCTANASSGSSILSMVINLEKKM